MPFSSSQISEMIGGQQVMFANNQQFAQVVGSSVGMNPPPQGRSMSSPSFGRAGYGGQDMYFWDKATAGGYGASLVGGMGGAIPSMASGIGIAGSLGLMGAGASHLFNAFDPFAGFARGLGASGFMGSMGTIGRGFAAGGLGGGMGAIGAGLAGAALPLAGAMAIGKGIDFVGQNIYAGAQNVSQMGAMANAYMGPQYGTPGFRPGGGVARGQIQQMTSILHEISDQETMTSMTALKRMVDQAGQMGMLTGITSAEQFRTKFRAVVGQAKEIAKIVGSSIEEAVPMLGQMQQMGLWTARDVMGTALSMKTVGQQAAPQLLGAMQSGAQRSYAMGGSLAAGASLGRNAFMNVQAAVQSGVFAPEMVQEMTGGVGGAEGQRMLAERLTEALQNTTQTPVGRLSMAGLGETQEGRFTGRIDKRKLQALMSGRLSVDDLQRMGQRNASTREGAASFTYRADQLGQDMMATGGLEGMASMFQIGLDRAGFGGSSEEIQGLMLQKMFGLQTRDAQMIQRMMREMPKIREQNARRQTDALRDAFQQAEEKQNRSWDGLKQALHKSIERTFEDPIQQFAERLTTGANEQFDRLTDWIWGRQRSLSMTEGERMRLLSRGGFGAANVNQANRLGQGSFLASIQTPYIERFREGGFSGLLGYGSTRAGALGNLGAQTRMGEVGDRVQRFAGGTSEPLNAAAEIQVAGGLVTTQREAEAAIRRAVARANPERKLSEAFQESAATNEAMAALGAAYKKAVFSPESSRLLKEAKEKMKPEEYQLYLRQMVDKAGGKEAFRALHALRKDGDATPTQTALDAMAQVQGMVGTHALEAEFQKVAGKVDFNALMQDSEYSRKYYSEGLESAYGALGTVRGSVLFGVQIDAGSGDPSKLQSLEGVSQRDLETFLTTAAGGELLEYAQRGGTGQAPTSGALADALRKGDKTAQSIFGRLGEMSSIQRQKFAEGAGRVMQTRQAKAYSEVAQERKKIAEEELKRGGISGLSEKNSGLYRKILEAYKGGRIEDNQRAEALTRELAQGLSSNELSALRASGGRVAGNIAEAGSVEQLGGVGDTKEQFMARLRKSGLSGDFAAISTIDPNAAAIIEQSFKGGLSKTGLSTIKEELRKVTKGGPTAAPEDVQEKLTRNLTEFAQANTKFVLAVAAATPSLDNAAVQELKKKIAALDANTAGKPGS